MPIELEDDYIHPDRGDHPYWNESAWFSFMVPERDLCGWIYFHHRPNMGYTMGGVAAWDPSGDQTWNCRYYDWGEPFPTPENAEMFDFELPNGLRVEMLEPQQSFRFGYHGKNYYEGRGCELELGYEAFAPPHDSGLPSGSEEWGSKGHYEQSGRMTGRINLGGEEIAIDCFSQRDHSWGVRRLQNNPRGHFSWAIASEESAFNAISVQTLPMELDPVDGTKLDVICGYYVKDGERASFRPGAGHISCVERAGDGRPLRFVAEATDTLGRVLHAEGTSKNMLHWHGYPFLMQWWPLVEWTYDGITAHGESQDYWPLQQARAYARSRS